MTEMQAAVGKVQLSKLDDMLNENYMRYDVLENMLGTNYKLREIPEKVNLVGIHSLYLKKIV